MNDDFRDLLLALLAEGARFLVVGAHALAVHGIPRATGDLDVWVEPEADNASRVHRALIRFGAPLTVMGVGVDDFLRAEQVVQIGVPPCRIDILTSISGVAFDEAWTGRVSHHVGGAEVPFLGREALLKNKRASGRTKDLADLEALGEDGKQ